MENARSGVQIRSHGATVGGMPDGVGYTVADFIRIYNVEFQWVENGVQDEQEKNSPEGIPPTQNTDDAMQVIG